MVNFELLFDNLGNLSTSKLKRFRETDDYIKVIKNTSWLKEEASLSERLYCVLNRLTDYPKCICGNNITKFRTFKNGYASSCSIKCGIKKNNTVDKRKATCLKKYGVEFATQSDLVKDKSKATCLDRYGVEFATQTSQMKEANKRTVESKYGVENISQLAWVKEKKKNNNIDYDKISDTKNKNKKKVRPIFNLLDDKEWLLNQYKNKTTVQIAKELDVAHSTVNNYLIKYDIDRTEWKQRSSYEVEIKEYVESLGFSVLSNDRKLISKEIDILVPGKLGIEFNGIYWHSVHNLDNDNSTNKNKHLIKTNLMEASGLQLIHIFENEWNNKKEIWKSVIKNKLGIVDTRIYARKCSVVKIDSKLGKAFINENHLQGSVIGGKYFGLIKDDELVACIQIGESRFSKKYDYEILRFCNKLGCSVVGGFSKLLNNCDIKGTIVSYANRRWSTGKMYKAVGFSLDSISAPSYYYVKDGKLFNRIMFQKHKLPKVLESFDGDLSESENMFNNGYHKIYDCGNMVFTIKRC